MNYILRPDYSGGFGGKGLGKYKSVSEFDIKELLLDFEENGFKIDPKNSSRVVLSNGVEYLTPLLDESGKGNTIGFELRGGDLEVILSNHYQSFTSEPVCNGPRLIGWAPSPVKREEKGIKVRINYQGSNNVVIESVKAILRDYYSCLTNVGTKWKKEKKNFFNMIKDF